MYRIPKDLNLDAIVGRDLDLLGLGGGDIQLNFSGSGIAMYIGGDVTLRHNGAVVATWNQRDHWSSLEFQKLLNATVSAYRIPNDRLLEIEFGAGLVLQLHDNSDTYESMGICYDPAIFHDEGGTIII